MRRSLRFIAAASVAAMCSARSAAAQGATRVVITAAEIQSAGWQRINEIFDAAPGWRITSTDGFTYTPSPDGLPAAGASGPGVTLPSVYVDGARVPVALFGVTELEFVPVVLAQLDSVVLSSEPQLVAGRLEMRGTVRFYTRKPERGVTARGEFQVGDVANKPGLFWYTPLKPPNREHIGPFEHFLLGIGGARVGLDVGVRFATLNTTDTLLLRRTHLPGSAGTGQINLPAPTAHLDVTALGGRHTIDATRAHYSGLFFIPAYGHEQSLRMNATTVAGSGSIRPGGGFGIDYSATFARNDVAALPSAYPSTVLHGRRDIEGTIELTHAVLGMPAGIGGGGQQWSLSGFPVTGSRGEGRAFAYLDRIGTGPVTSRVSAVLTRTVRSTTLGGVLTSEWRPDALDAVHFTAASQTEDPQADGRWIDSTVLFARGDSARRRISSANLEWTRRLARGLSLVGGAGVSAVSAWPTALPSDTGTFELRGGVPSASVSGGLTVARASVGVETDRHERWYGRVLYSYASSIGGDSLVRTAQRSVARHQVNGQAWIVPARDWRVMTLVQAVSSTYWAAYPPLATGWPSDVSGFSRVDLGVEKWMWRRHVRFQYQVRDIFNRSERWQPRSVEFNLRWLASASFVLGARD